jgi:hypothetical protein
MEPHEPTPILPSEPLEAAPSGLTPSVSGPASAVHRQSIPVLFWAIAAGVVAALVSWLLIEATLGTFKPTTSATRIMNSTFLIAGPEERATAESRNAALAWGLTGGTVGLALGLAGGLARRSARTVAAVASGFLGLALGAGAGVGGSLVALPLATLVHDRDPGNMSAEMAASLLTHGGTWGAIGAAGGLAFGIGQSGRGRAIRGLVGGLLGAVAGAILFELIGELALPDTKIKAPVAATWGVRLLSQALAVIPAAVGVAALVFERTSKQHQSALDTR